MKTIEEFIKERISQVSRNNSSNCMGTAFYLSGEEEEDRYFSREESRKKLAGMKKVKEPELGCVVSWTNNRIPYHAGVIFMENPFYVVYRNKDNGTLMQLSLEDFNSLWFKETNLKSEYRMSNKLRDKLK